MPPARSSQITGVCCTICARKRAFPPVCLPMIAASQWEPALHAPMCRACHGHSASRWLSAASSACEARVELWLLSARSEGQPQMEQTTSVRRVRAVIGREPSPRRTATQKPNPSSSGRGSSCARAVGCVLSESAGSAFDFGTRTSTSAWHVRHHNFPAMLSHSQSGSSISPTTRPARIDARTVARINLPSCRDTHVRT